MAERRGDWQVPENIGRNLKTPLRRRRGGARRSTFHSSTAVVQRARKLERPRTLICSSGLNHLKLPDKEHLVRT